MSYVGELGYELHVPREYALYLYDALWSAGEAFGIANVGYRAINSLRLEKQYLVWGSDITPDYNPYEAGLGFCVALGKGDFAARAALAEVKAERPATEARLVQRAGRASTCGAARSCWPAIASLGRVTSAGYGYTVGRNLFCAYIAADEPADAHYAVEVMGVRYPAVRHARPLYDPDRKAILADD